MSELPEEELLVAEAEVVASRLIDWFRERVLESETHRDAAVKARELAEDERRVADEERDAADKGRVSAEDDRRISDRQRAEAEQRVIKVELLLAASEELAEQLQTALDSRIAIEQAKGFLVARHDITPDVAFEAMRSYSRARRVALRDVAVGVISGTTHLEV